MFGKALKIKVKKFKQNLAENYSKSTKIAIRACTFSKIFRGSMPPAGVQIYAEHWGDDFAKLTIFRYF